MAPPAAHRAVLRVVCNDRPGLVADVAALLFKLGVNILHADEHIDPEANTFFQRLDFLVSPEAAAGGREAFRKEIGSHCDGWGMRWSLRFRDELRRVAVLVSKRPHCGLDLLARHRAGELSCEIPVVISNHPDMEREVTRRGYSYAHEGIVGGDKAAQEVRVRERLKKERIDLVVLARYMQILTPAFVDEWPEKIINIHHSFLPAFVGADPYRQAYRRGVKLIGATSHYVTKDLDEGPIIAQSVERVSHRDAVEDLERMGRDLERVVLAHAVRLHLEDRIIAYGNKTVVFD
ncbi:MAG TPA: formyltetrahydrofolate deformylase [Myxococcales bacterium]|jgi:formyltetrahydrofolate deformylase